MKLEMVDDEGENRAVRMFLALYGGACGVTAEQMRKHLKMAGFDGAWPDWADSHNGHLTKAGAQLWIRHLFALAEQPAPVQQEPVATDWERVARAQNAKLMAMCNQPGGMDKLREVLLAAAPQPAQRTWVGLTDEERQACTQSPFTAENYLVIEAKLKEKNT